MSRLEDELRQLEAEFLDYRTEYYKRHKEIKDQLEGGAVKCTHKYLREFEWEHDNGYGRQTKCKGVACDSCGMKDHYPETALKFRKTL